MPGLSHCPVYVVRMHLYREGTDCTHVHNIRRNLR